MQELLVAVMMACAIEGVLYALVPEKMQEAMRTVIEMKPETLRISGLLIAAASVAVIVLIRG